MHPCGLNQDKPTKAEIDSVSKTLHLQKATKSMY
jgi:hypothetical protein